MDTRGDRALYAIEKKYGPAECDCDGTCELAFMLAGNVHHYKNLAEKEADADHHRYCPMAREGKHTLCVCAELEKADAASKQEGEECSRCHSLAVDCKCGPKAQLI